LMIAFFQPMKSDVSIPLISRENKVEGDFEVGFVFKDTMAKKVQEDFQLLLQSYKKIKALSKEIGTATDSSRLRENLQKELDSAETITSRMMGDIARIDNKTKKSKLQTQLNKTRNEIETLRKDIEKEERLNSVKQTNPWLNESNTTEENFGNFSVVGRAMDQSIEFQSFHGNQKVAEDREAAIFQIQKDTEQVAEVFQDLKEMVEDQAVGLDIVETNVEKTAMNVKAGLQELDKAEQYQKAKRKKMCMLLLCLIIIGGLLAIILATQN
jgi:t-SNARE complex subunit (syntaxin)